MTIESDYLAVLETTRRMADAASAQDWETLAEHERQRSLQLAVLTPIERMVPAPDAALSARLTRIVEQIDQANGQVLEHASVWLEHVKVLLRQGTTEPH